MTVPYLASTEYAAYGVPAGSDVQVAQACAYLDGYLKRKEGIVWAPDAAGNPCYMARMTPRLTWTFPGSIAPGVNVVVTAPTNLFLSQDVLGEVLILDRANAGAVEAVVISAIDQAAGKVTLAQVTYAHTGPVTAEFGMLCQEERQVPAKRSMIRLAYNDAVRLVSGVGRYGYGRRSDQIQGMYNEINLLATLQTFGGPPQWIPFDARQASISPGRSELWVPAGILLAYYSDVRVWYVAGLPTTGVPELVKQAVAAVAAYLVNSPPEFVAGGIRKYRAGDTEIDRFSADLFASPQYALLASYRANSFS
jgi:hypothetical protein